MTRHLRAMAWLALCALLCYGALLDPGRTSMAIDVLQYHLGSKGALYQALHNGTGLPAWRPDQFSGAPALTNPQTLLTYPLHALFLLLPPERAMGPTLFLHVLLAGAGFYVLGLALDLSAEAALVMATAGLCSFKLIMALGAGWLTVLPIIALLPWLFAAALAALQRPGKRTAAMLGLLGALTLHGGSPQLPYYLALLLLPYVGLLLYRLWTTGDRKQAARVAGTLAGAGALALGLSAYLLWPMIAERSLISRSAADFEFFRFPQGRVEPRHLLTLLWPEWLSAADRDSVFLWEVTAYFGLVPLLLAAVAVMRRGRWVPLLLTWLCLSVVLAVDSPLHRLAFEHLPGFRLFRCPGRMLYLTTLFGIALGGFGFDALALQGRRRQAALAAALCLMSAEGAWYARRHVQLAATSAVFPAVAWRAPLAADHGLYRVAPLDRDVVDPAWAATYGLQLVTGYDPYNLAHYQQYIDCLTEGRIGPPRAAVRADLNRRVARWDLLDALNVKYLLSIGPVTGADEHLALVGQWPDQEVNGSLITGDRAPVALYQNRRALKRAFFPQRAIEVGAEADMQREVMQRGLRGTAIVLRPGMPRQGLEPSGAAPRAEVLHSAPGELLVKADVDAARYLILSEVWHPGWQATLDGQPVDLFRADLALMAVWLPPGDHQVELRFRPPLLRWGLWLSGLCAALCVALLARPTPRSPRR